MFERRQRVARYRLERGYWCQWASPPSYPQNRGRDREHRTWHWSWGCRRYYKRFFWSWSELEFKVSLTKRPYRRNRKAYVLLEEARALRLLKATYIKIGCVSCRVRRKMEVNRWYRCLGFGHMAANCRGSDWSRSCQRCGEKGHAAGFCTMKPQYYLCSARGDKPWGDHIPGTMWCATFREGAPSRKSSRGRVWSQAGNE